MIVDKYNLIIKVKKSNFTGNKINKYYVRTKMNKKLTFLIAFLALVSLSFISCSESFENEFKIVNNSQAPLELLFGSKTYNVAPGETLVLNDFTTESSYAYECRFPATYNVSGAVSGEISFIDEEADDNRTVALKAMLYVVSVDADIEVYLTVENLTGVVDPLVGP